MAALRAITAPTLVIHGANDLQSEASSRSFADAIPNADFERIRGAGHFPFLDQREAFAAAVGRFLSSVR